MAIDYGYLVSGDIVRKVFNQWGIDAGTYIGPDGMEINYEGQPFKIIQRDVWFPPSDTSPDGIHLLYSPSEEEVVISKQRDEPLFKPILPDFSGILGSAFESTVDIGKWLLIAGFAAAGVWAVKELRSNYRNRKTWGHY